MFFIAFKNDKMKALTNYKFCPHLKSFFYLANITVVAFCVTYLFGCYSSWHLKLKIDSRSVRELRAV